MEVGDLFIYDFNGGASAALKVEDPQSDGDKLILLLGPKFPGNSSRPCLIPEERIFVLSFGKNYKIQLPTDPESWAINYRPSNEFDLVLDSEGNIYFRLTIQHRELYIDMKNGRLCHGQPVGAVAYPKSWKIITLSDKENGQVIVQNVSLGGNAT